MYNPTTKKYIQETGESPITVQGLSCDIKW